MMSPTWAGAQNAMSVCIPTAITPCELDARPKARFVKTHMILSDCHGQTYLARFGMIDSSPQPLYKGVAFSQAFKLGFDIRRIH